MFYRKICNSLGVVQEKSTTNGHDPAQTLFNYSLERRLEVDAGFRTSMD